MDNLKIQDLTMESQVRWNGRLQARLKRASSDEWKKLWEKAIKNKVVNAGLARMAYRVISDTGAPFKYGAIGTGSTAATASDTALESQILTRIAAVLTTDTTAIVGDTAKLVSTFTSDTNSYAVTEYGSFETASGAPMLNRVTFGAITLNLNDVLEFTYTLQNQEG